MIYGNKIKLKRYKIKVKKSLIKIRKRLNDFFLLIIWFFNKPKISLTDKIQLHLGCGEINVPGFINVDKRPFKHVHYLSDVGNLKFIRDNQADLIYISHCLEHIPKNNLELVLKEYYRALKAGGILRISVPDFEKILCIYQDTNELIYILDPLFGSQEYKQNFHYVVFDQKYLEFLLSKCGFKNVRKWNHGDGELKSIPDWSGRKINIGDIEYEISLNIEAEKQ